MDRARSPYDWRGVGLVVTVQAAALLAMAPFYGPHRDELYFVSAGRRLAWGYADQPSFTPFLARLATEVAPYSLVALRVAPTLAAIGIVLLAVHYARLLGAARAGQLLTAVVVATSAILMALGHRLNTAVFDTLAWTAVLVLVAQAVADRRPRLWLVAGLVAGVGLNNKHSVVFVLLGVLVACALDPALRPALRSAYPWLAGVIALVLWIPNLLWQAAHSWPALDLSADIASEYGGVGGRVALVLQLAIIFSPLMFLVWAAGLVRLLRSPDRRPYRLPALVFLVVLAVFLVTGGKAYYLAGAVVPLLAAGCTWVADRWRTRADEVGFVLALSAAVAWPALVPVLPVATYAGSFYPAIDADQAETIGWPEYAATVRGVVADLPPGAVVFTGDYGEAGAFEWYGVGADVYSGHNGWREWGPPPDSALPVVAVGFDPGDAFTGCRQEATLRNDLGLDNEEQRLPVWVCDGPTGSWAQVWPDLVHYDA